MYFIKLFIIATGIAMTESKVNQHGPTVVDDFTSCLFNLIDKNFVDSGMLIFTNSKKESTSAAWIRSQLMMKIHKTIKYSIEVMSPGKEVDVCGNYDEKLGILHKDSFEAKPLANYFVMILDDFKDFPHLTSKILRSRSWNPSAKFILLLLNFAEDQSNVKLIESMMTCLFKYNVIDVMIVVPKQNAIRKALIYSWKAYDPPKYCGHFHEIAANRSYIENTCEKGALTKNMTITDRLPNDMMGCLLYILALERQPFVSKDENDANMERDYINELASVYNFKTSYKIINSFRGERESVGQWNGALRELTLKKGQVLLGGIFPDFDVHEDFECSSSYLADHFTWVVPRANLSPPWIALLIIFNRVVWYTVIAGFSVCALFWRILGQLSKDTTYNRSLHHCFLNAWICTLGFCAYKRPKKQSLRVFFCFFNIYCVVFITAYQTKLIDVLKNPSFDYQIQTTEDLVESGIPFGGFEELHDLFFNSGDYFDDLIYENWIYVDDMATALTDVAVHRNFSVLVSRLELIHVSSTMGELSDRYGNYRYYPFKLNMFSVPLEMVALRGFAFMKKFTQTLGILKQSGINSAVRRKFADFNALRRAKLVRLFEKKDYKPLSLKHLEGGFLILVFGHVGGAFVLGIEIIVNTDLFKRKVSQRFRNKKNY